MLGVVFLCCRNENPNLLLQFFTLLLHSNSVTVVTAVAVAPVPPTATRSPFYAAHLGAFIPNQNKENPKFFACPSSHKFSKFIDKISHILFSMLTKSDFHDFISRIFLVCSLSRLLPNETLR